MPHLGTERAPVRLGPVALVVALLLGAVLAAPAVAGPANPAGPAAPGASGAPGVPTSAPDPRLVTGLDGVVALSPADTCVRVDIDGSTVYRHRADESLVPASTQKLVTGAVALDQLGAEHRFRTRVLAPAAPAGGVVTGDLVLVGGGDPLLTTTAYAFVRRTLDQPLTPLDDLADRVVASGVTRVTGRVLGDESRYDQERTVASWPDRYVRQNQVGPLSGLTVDDGFTLALPPPGDDEPPERTRSGDPAGDAARTFAELLRARGVQIDGVAAAGPAPAGAVEVAGIESVPMQQVVGQMLQESDNGTAELLTKEIGLVATGSGSTAAGLTVIERRAAELGFAGPGTDAVDGSGLDPANRATCDELVALLDGSGGAAGPVGSLLPVAGRSGTLEDRYRGTAAEGRLRAKTGTLKDVTALAGFVDLAGGGTATFAYIANGAPPAGDQLRGLDLLAPLLGQYEATCAERGSGPLVAPVAPYAGQMGALAMFPLQTVLLPGAALSLHVFEDRYRALVDHCLAADEEFGVVLISRGSEVGGGDQRTDVGTRARIVQAEQSPDGRWGILAVGTRRVRIDRWLPDDPHPWADVAEWPDPEPLLRHEVEAALAATTRRLRRVLALHTELGEPGPPATVDVPAHDPIAASYHLVGLAPLGPLDRQHLLAAPDVARRLDLLDDLLADDEAVARARLGGV